MGHVRACLLDRCHGAIVDAPQVTAHNRRSYPEKDNFLDNQLAVFDYPHTLATVRCNHIDPFGFPRRHFHVVGELGNFEINPLEPPKIRLAFDQPRGNFKKGFQEVEVQARRGRYDAEFEDLANVILGKKKLAWDSQHDLAVHESVLLASGEGLSSALSLYVSAFMGFQAGIPSWDSKHEPYIVESTGKWLQA